MAYTASFVRGAQKIDLSSGSYQLERDFVPPAMNTAWNVGEGLSSNNNGGELFGSKEQDRYWSFRIKVNGTTAEHSRMLANSLRSFLSSSKDNTYFYFKNNTLPEPLWGQFGASLRYKIITADASIGELYGLTGMRAYRWFIDVTLRVAPNAEGIQQRVCNARGGIYEETLGNADGSSKGLRIPEPCINKLVNPVFSHATWNQGWGAGAGIIVAQNIDKRYVFPGCANSAKIIGTTGGTYGMSLNVGNTNNHAFSFYVCKPDFGVITTSDVGIYYGAGKTTTITSLGGGFYRMDWIGAGVASATTTGISVAAGEVIYLIGGQVEEQSYVKPLTHGDMLGCSWTSTVGASTSNRAAGVVALTLDNADFDLGMTTIEIVWQTDYSNAHLADMSFFFDNNANIKAQYKIATDTFYLQDGTNSISSAAQTFAARDTLHLMFSFGPGGLNIWKNGANIATGATYTAPALPTTLYIGSDQTGASQPNGIIRGFDILECEVTAAQALASYTETAAIIAGGGRVSTLPWIWTKDGDGTIDNCDDSTHDNWCVVGGVPGNVAAKRNIRLAANTAKAACWFGGMDMDTFVNPSGQWYHELGTSVDANYSGSAYSETLASWPGGTAAPTLQTLGTVRFPDKFNGSKMNLFVAMASDGAILNFSPFTRVNDYTNKIYGETKRIVPSGTARLIYHLGNIPVIPYFDGEAETILRGFGMYAITDSGSSTLKTDFLLAIPGEIAYVKNAYPTDPQTVVIAEDNQVLGRGTYHWTNPPEVGGDLPEILPGKYNLFWGISGDHNEANTITDTITITVKITPRWSLL